MKIEKEDIAKVTEAKLDQEIPSFFHSPYAFSLINAFEKTKEGLLQELTIAGQLANCHVVIHPGSCTKIGTYEKGMDAIVANLKELYSTNPQLGNLLLENTAGQGKTVPATMKQAGELLKAIGNPKVGMCFDTCHGFASGEANLSTIEGVDEFYEKVQKHIGIDNIRAIHLNDSKTPFGSKKDRHEALGKGFIWKDNLPALTHFLEKFKGIPAISETGSWNEDKAIIEQAIRGFPISYGKNDLYRVLHQVKSEIPNPICTALGNVLERFIIDLGKDLRDFIICKGGVEINPEDIIACLTSNKKYDSLIKKEEFQTLIANLSAGKDIDINEEEKKDTLCIKNTKKVKSLAHRLPKNKKKKQIETIRSKRLSRSRSRSNSNE